jgi:hypothetical protein
MRCPAHTAAAQHPPCVAPFSPPPPPPPPPPRRRRAACCGVTASPGPLLSRARRRPSSIYAMSKKANPKVPVAVQQTPNSAGAAGAGAASEWTVGALCTAKYAADGKFYPAQVVEVTPKGVKVSFTEYENECQVCAADDLKVLVVETGPTKSTPKAAPVSPKQGPKVASPSLGPMKSVSPRGSPTFSPKFSPVDAVKQASPPPPPSSLLLRPSLILAHTSGGACPSSACPTQGHPSSGVFPIHFRPWLPYSRRSWSRFRHPRLGQAQEARRAA